jgi:hypothetical protein
MQSKQMALIALGTIGAIDYLGDGTILACVMFCSKVAGKKCWRFLPARKSVDDRQEVVCAASPYNTCCVVRRIIINTWKSAPGHFSVPQMKKVHRGTKKIVLAHALQHRYYGAQKTQRSGRRQSAVHGQKQLPPLHAAFLALNLHHLPPPSARHRTQTLPTTMASIKKWS